MKAEILNTGFGPRIYVDNKELPPFAFKSFRPTKKNISDFYNAGVRTFCVLSTGIMSATKGVPYSHFGESWIDDYTYDFNPIDNQIDLFICSAPEAYLDIMLAVDTREWWLKKYPDYPNSFWNLSQVCSDEKWRKAALAYLVACVNHIEQKYGDKVFAYHILGGATTEWLSENDYEQASSIKEVAYKKYLNSSSAVIPTCEERELPVERAFLDPIKDSNLIAYRKFHSELIADTILYFAKGVKEAVDYKKLVGVYYGYLLELGGPRLWNSGQIACDKIFNSKYVDIISAPSAYTWFRRKEGTVGYMVTVDSLTLNNKIFYQEFDHRTYLPSLQFESSKPLVGCTDGAKDRRETIDMIRRELISVKSKGQSMWWFDMFEGWYYDDLLMDEIRKCFEIDEKLSSLSYKSNSEIAVIVDSESLYYVNKNAHINSELISWERAELSKMGAPYDMFMSSNLDKIDFSQYKLVIFLNQFKHNKDYEKIINDNIKQNNRTILWVYAPNYISNKFDVNMVSDTIGMKAKKVNPPETVVNVNDKRFGFTFPKDTMFFIDVDGDDYFTTTENGVDVLGRYQICLRPALVSKNCGNYTSVFSASGYISAEVLREIAKRAGVHIYSNNNDNVVYVNSEMIGVYHRMKSDAEICLKEDGEYVDLFSKNIYVSKNKKLLLTYEDVTMVKCLIKNI